MAGFWGGRGVFQMRADDTRVGESSRSRRASGRPEIGLLLVQLTIGIPSLDFTDPNATDNQMRFVLISLGLLAVGVLVAWSTGRTVFKLDGEAGRAKRYLQVAAALTAGLLIFAVVRLLIGPSGYFSTVDGVLADGKPDSFLGGANLTGLALADPGGLVVAIAIAFIIGALVWTWARRGENARLFPVWIGGLTTGFVAAAISAPIAAAVFGGVTGGGTDALIALFRTLGLNVFQSAFAQGLTSDPLDKTISYTIVYLILIALPITVRTMFSRGEVTIAEPAGEPAGA